MRVRSFIFTVAAITFASISILSQTAQAKELTNRLGIGYANQFSTDLPSLAVRYFPDPKIGVGAELGVDTNQGDQKFGLMARLYRIVFTEDNMNFYMGTAAGLISIETANASGTGNTTSSGFELSGYVGAEFFLPGLENLGFSFEGGVGVSSVSSQVRFRTIGDSPLKAGMIFYF
jgi:hypothetical protein